MQRFQAIYTNMFYSMQRFQAIYTYRGHSPAPVVSTPDLHYTQLALFYAEVSGCTYSGHSPALVSTPDLHYTYITHNMFYSMQRFQAIVLRPHPSPCCFHTWPTLHLYYTQHVLFYAEVSGYTTEATSQPVLFPHLISTYITLNLLYSKLRSRQRFQAVTVPIPRPQSSARFFHTWPTLSYKYVLLSWTYYLRFFSQLT